jgi:hypothetical protein
MPICRVSRNALQSLSLALPLLFLAGCGSNLESTVSGSVTLDGKKIGPGVVNFSPAAGDQNPAVGTIMPDGSYTLKSSRTAGLAAGKYRVAVTVFAQQSGERTGEAPKLVTPEKYNTIETSGLEYDVVPGSNTIDLELVSK